MNILVTGGAGFIGSELVSRLIEEHHYVTVLDDLSTGKTIDARSNFVFGDVSRKADILRAIPGVDCIFHLAAVSSVPKSIVDPQKTYKVNVDGTAILLEMAKDFGVKKFFFTSSSAVYGGCKEPLQAESSPKEPLSPYASSKLFGENWCDVYKNKMQICILRLFNVYGKGQNISAVVPGFIHKLMNDECPTICGNGEQTRDFIYIEDVISAYLHCLNKNLKGIYNVGSGNSISVNELFHIIAGIMKKNISPVYTDKRIGDADHTRADITKIKSTGYNINWNIENGVSLIAEKIWKA